MVISNKPSGTGRHVGRDLPGVGVQFAAVALAGAAMGGVLAWGLTEDAVAVLSGLVMYGAVTGVALVTLTAGFPHRTIGLCNVATLARLALVLALVACLVADGAPPWGVFAVAVLAFALDGLDGWLARSEGRASGFGARFDMEVDSLLALVLAALAWQSGSVGAYIIILGLPRYAFWIAQFPCPWLNGDLPERFSRKVVCVVQISALILALVPSVPPFFASTVVGASALALIWSFWLDVQVLREARA